MKSHMSRVTLVGVYEYPSLTVSAVLFATALLPRYFWRMYFFNMVFLYVFHKFTTTFSPWLFSGDHNIFNGEIALHVMRLIGSSEPILLNGRDSQFYSLDIAICIVSVKTFSQMPPFRVNFLNKYIYKTKLACKLLLFFKIFCII